MGRGNRLGAPGTGGGAPNAENVMRAHVNRNASGTVLFVDGFEDAVLERCRAALESGGQPTERVRDVYAAMARLSESPAVSQVIVDVRYLDEAECAFLMLAPRYFQNVEIIVPTLEGPNDWMKVDVPGVRRASPDSLPGASALDGSQSNWWSEPAAPSNSTATDASAEEADESCGPTEFGVPLTQDELDALAQDGFGVSNGDDQDNEIEPSAGIAEAPRSMPVLPDRPLSTDRGPDESGDKESLHDAVRRRMSGDRGRVVRRRPPGSDAPDESEDISSPFHDALPAGDLSEVEWSADEEDELVEGDEWHDEPESDEGARE